MKRPLILVTNDDGITAPGIRNLVEVAREFGEVVVVAPNKPQSAQGHAITIEQPLRLYKDSLFEGIESYECSGTPVDCVKLAKSTVLRGRKADICLSGINHGSNASINVLYSGTMSAAMEASLEGIDSVGFSSMAYDYSQDFEAAKHFARIIIKNVLEHGLGETKLLNVNIPHLPVSEIKGIRICRQGQGNWTEDYRENTDPMGRKYYWLAGQFSNVDHGTDHDLWAVENGYVAVVPVMHDLTAYKAINRLKAIYGNE